LTPLGVYWEDTIAYDDPDLHGGFAYWPAGDPDDGKSGSGAVPGADGDGGTEAAASGKKVAATGAELAPGAERRQPDGQLYRRITPIAVHFKERLSGYRIYRKGPLDADWALLPNPEDGESPVTIAHPEAQANAPVRYSFGRPRLPRVYEYYLISFAMADSTSSAVESVLNQTSLKQAGH
jgi:hypothetical protein